MKNKSISFLALALALGFLASAGKASAQTSYTLLEELPIIGKTVALDSGGLNAYLQTIFNLGIGIAIALAVVMIVIGGAQYLSTDALTGKTEGRSKLAHAVGGLILALGVFVILYTVNPDILKLNLDLKNSLKKAEKQNVQISTPTTTIPTIVKRTEGVDTSANKDEAAIREKLKAAGVSVNKNPCPKGVKYQDVAGGCTTLAGLSNATVDKIIALKTGCGCSVEITGGTELGHKTHGIQYSNIVDLSLTSDLLGWIKNNGTATSYSGCSVGNKYTIDFAQGIIGQKSVFVDEKIDGNYPHFHVCF